MTAPQINGSRVLVGGLAAGLVMNVIDAVTNGMVLGAQWQREVVALNPDLMRQAAATSTTGWIIVDFLLGLLLVWLYAAIRPRFGAGPLTAVLAALVVWLIAHAVYASYVFMGLFSASLITVSSVGGVVAALAGGLLGARLYRE